MKLEFDRKLTPKEIAGAFIELDDERMAQFFIEAAALAEQWRPKGNPGMQWHLVGGHLRDCSCSTYEAKDMIESIRFGMLSRRTHAFVPPHHADDKGESMLETPRDREIRELERLKGEKLAVDYAKEVVVAADDVVSESDEADCTCRGWRDKPADDPGMCAPCRLIVAVRNYRRSVGEPVGFGLFGAADKRRSR